MDDFTPETEPSGALVPPPRVPPTALALASPAPAPMRRTTQTACSAKLPAASNVELASVGITELPTRHWSGNRSPAHATDQVLESQPLTLD